MALIPTDPIWIDDNQSLAELCARWSQQAAIAVDTEFMRSDTFYPIAGLLQIGDGKGCYLIDPLAITHLEPLKALLLNDKVTKVLHSCSEDLEMFDKWLGLIPSPLFDTQIAAAFAGLGYGLGYANLVKAVLGIEIPKNETRSDWLARPLSISQLNYAALDVAHMLVVYGKILQTLKSSERLEWVKQDCVDLVEKARAPVDFSDAYQKVGFAFKLRSNELAVLKALSMWRESEARLRDIPRNRLIKESCMWEVARRKPTTLSQLSGCGEIPQRTLKNDGETILSLVAAALDGDPSTFPPRVEPPLAQSQGPLMKALKAYVRERAEQMDIPSEILIRKKEYEQIVRSGLKGGTYQLPERLLGWRYPIIGEGLLQIATTFVASTQAEEQS
ncbi:MAG: ribonuclease D [Cellvibrio sp.]